MIGNAGKHGWVWRAALTAIALVMIGLVGAEPAAGAAPRPAAPAAPAQPGCIEIARDVYTIPDHISPPDHPHDYGSPTDEVPGYDANLLVRYCEAGDGWDKARDAFPYDSPDVCVAVYPSEDGYDDVLTPLSAIDVYGIMPVRSGSDTVFCRSGDTWERQRAPGEDPPPAPDCMTVTRWVFTPPRIIDPPATPETIGRQRQVVVDERFTTTYCLRDGVWRLTADNFPYSSPDECVAVHYDLDEHDRTPPPDTIFPIGEIDELGHIDNAGGAGGTANLETYCRDGDVWKRTARADDMPSGSYKSWAEECKTIYVDPGIDPPLRLDDDPANHGDTNLDQFTVDQIMTIGPRSFPTYCRSGTHWFRVDDYPLDEAIPRLKGRLGQPGIEDSCAVIRYPKNDYYPDVLPANADPGYLGGYWSIRYPFDDTSSSGDYIGTYPVEHMYCYVNGRWRRGDKLTNCESAEEQAAEGLVPEDCWGAQLTGKYDIGYDGGDALELRPSDHRLVDRPLLQHRQGGRPVVPVGDRLGVRVRPVQVRPHRDPHRRRLHVQHHEEPRVPPVRPRVASPGGLVRCGGPAGARVDGGRRDRGVDRRRPPVDAAHGEPRRLHDDRVERHGQGLGRPARRRPGRRPRGQHP